ncbi:MAG: M10 family metallopeptidase C-terminal domain-containing protein [Hyphomicrobiaceae bacterium]|nr:M10 family metallopeptidase C-terminal domain-containing protein [Hyphomicrobiaceae bacterium]
MAKPFLHKHKTDNPYVNALTSTTIWQNDDGSGGGKGTTVVKIFFDKTGAGGYWTDQEVNLFMQQLESIEAVANIDFQVATYREEADLIEYKVLTGTSPLPTPNPAAHYGPFHDGMVDELGGYYNVEYKYTTSENAMVPLWTLPSMAQGGAAGQMILHEILHAVGLDHPFDQLMGSGIWPSDPNAPPTTFQTTLMSGDLWGKFSTDFGHAMSPMAFDIAALQLLYGANTDHNSGNDVYLLPDANTNGTGWMSIWDTGGTDSIEYRGTQDAVIDLRAATLEGPLGGGNISSADTIEGGYTIANGVEIENARGGSGDDGLIGNDLANTLVGGGGADHYVGNGGNDTIYVDAADLAQGIGYEWLDAGGGTDTVIYAAGTGTTYLALKNTGVEVVRANRANDVIDGRDSANGLKLYGNLGNDYLAGSSYKDLLYGQGDDDTFVATAGNDRIYGDSGNDTYVAFDAVGDLKIDLTAGRAEQGSTLFGVFNGAGASSEIGIDALYSIENAVGGHGDDFIIGNGLDNILAGGFGDDDLWGGLGVDTFKFIYNGGSDTIHDWQKYTDKLDISDVWQPDEVHDFADVIITSDGVDAHVEVNGIEITIAGASGVISQYDFII